MSNSPCAHAPHGTGSGRRTTPTTRSPAAKSLPAGASRTRPSDSCPSTTPSPPGRPPPRPPPPRAPPAVLAADDLDVGAAHPERNTVDEQLAIAGLRVRHLGDLGGALLQRYDRECAHSAQPNRASSRRRSAPAPRPCSSSTAR